MEGYITGLLIGLAISLGYMYSKLSNKLDRIEKNQEKIISRLGS